MRIILAGNLSNSIEDEFRRAFPDDDIRWVADEDIYHSEKFGAECIIVRTFRTTEAVFLNNPELRAVIRWGAGYDSVDLGAANRCGVMVANAPGINSYAVSELAVAMMLSLKRDLFRYNTRVKEGVWNQKEYAASSETLNMKTVGIIGCGNIGKRVAMQVRCFGASVQYYDLYRLSEKDEKDFCMEYTELDTLLRTSDIISLHIPLTEKTHHMIGREELSIMKKSSIIINTARGGLIDDLALAEAIDNGSIAGAGLDCLENENVIDNPLCRLERVILSPHIGGTSKDLSSAMIPYMVEQIRLLKEKGEVRNIVNSFER